MLGDGASGVLEVTTIIVDFGGILFLMITSRRSLQRPFQSGRLKTSASNKYSPDDGPPMPVDHPFAYLDMFSIMINWPSSGGRGNMNPSHVISEIFEYVIDRLEAGEICFIARLSSEATCSTSLE